jgi:hypothetical protein
MVSLLGSHATEADPHNRNIIIRARTSDRNVNKQVLTRGRKIQPNNIPMAITTGP